MLFLFLFEQRLFRIASRKYLFNLIEFSEQKINFRLENKILVAKLQI